MVPSAWSLGEHVVYPFVTPLGLMPASLWIVAVIIGREVHGHSTAATRGASRLVISAIGRPSSRRSFRTSGSQHLFWSSRLGRNAI